MRILRLLDKDVYVKAVILLEDTNDVSEIDTSFNAFKALDVTTMDEETLKAVAKWVRANRETLLEVIQVIE